jgi:hypothetical protein
MRTWVTDTEARQHGLSLSRLFSSQVVRELATVGHSALAKRVLSDAGVEGSLDARMTLAECYEGLYSALFKNYRNEYLYKNTVARRVLLGRHSLKTATMLTELRAADCKADCVVLNGTSTVYEIKSEFDSTARLQRQIAAYRRVFDRVNVVTSARQIDSVRRVVDENIGLVVLNERHYLTTIREAVSGKRQVTPADVFDSLRQSEYSEIIENRCGYLPDVSNGRLYAACRQLFMTLSPEDAHDAMVGALKTRGRAKSLREFIESVPPSLKAASLACSLKASLQRDFIDLLHSRAQRCLLTA